MGKIVHVILKDSEGMINNKMKSLYKSTENYENLSLVITIKLLIDHKQ